MDDFDTVQDRLTKALPTLPPQLKRAATYFLDNPGDVATLSMRKVASNADVALPNFARLAKAVGFDTYNELRAVYCKRVQSGGPVPYPERAINLQSSGENFGSEAVWAAFRDAAHSSIKSVFDHIDATMISAIAEELQNRRYVYLAGLQSSQPFMRYLHYIGGMASPSMRLVGRDGSLLAEDLADLNDEDAVICLAIRPCARATVQIAQLARERGALVIAITDSRASPLAARADRILLTPINSPSFFDSYIGSTAIIEMLIGFYTISDGSSTVERMERIEADRKHFGAYWNEEDTI